MRLDADLVAVLKSFGKGYQSKTNEILRSVVMEHKMPVLDFLTKKSAGEGGLASSLLHF